jgi:hypothetical protein
MGRELDRSHRLGDDSCMTDDVQYICCGKDCGLDVTEAVLAAFREREWGVKGVTAVEEKAPESVVVTCPNGHTCRYVAS